MIFGLTLDTGFDPTFCVGIGIGFLAVERNMDVEVKNRGIEHDFGIVEREIRDELTAAECNLIHPLENVDMWKVF